MIKKIGKVVSLALVSISVLGSAACSTEKRKTGDNVIWVAFCEAGYGRGYLESWIEAFKEAYPETDWQFELEGDSQLTGEIATRLSTDNEIPDLFFGLSTSWQQWAARGYLEPLDDIYAAPADENMTIEEFMNPEARIFGKVNGHYYAVPWSDSTNGFIYNKGMFDEYHWEVPETVDDLYALCDKINALDVNKDTDKGNDIAPFAWGGQVISYWDFVVQNWWAQYEGVENYTEFFKYESPEVFNQEGRLKALEIFENLIVGEDGVPKNSYSGAMGDSHILSQMAFLQGKAAMIPMGAWMETEMKKTMPEGFEMRLMPTPLIDGAKTDAEGKPVRVNASSAGDFLVIPKNAPNMEGAKKFMTFINTRQATYLWTEKTGSMRPFQYKSSDIQGLKTSDFIRSCLDVYDSSVTVYEFSENPMYWLNYVGKWAGIGSPYSRMVVDNETAADMIRECSQHVSDNWKTWIDAVK